MTTFITYGSHDANSNPSLDLVISTTVFRIHCLSQFFDNYKNVPV